MNATNNHAKSATFYEQSSKKHPKQEVAIVGKRWRLNQPLQSCGAIRNTLSATAQANTVNSINIGDYPHNHQTTCLSNYMTSIASDDNSSIAFIDEDPPPYAVHLGASLTPPGPVTEV